MRRADRLFRLTQILRDGRLHTAQKLAERMEVSPRTIYRDIADLMASGVPVDGEAGVGYVMRGGFDLPPLMFTAEEITALVAGARLIRAWGGAAMARGADEALGKIHAVLPEAARRQADSVSVHAFEMPDVTPAIRARIDLVERAVTARHRLVLDYSDEGGARTERTVRPLGLWFWGKVWTLVGWCELRTDFRMFRLDRIAALSEGEAFAEEPGKRLEDFCEVLPQAELSAHRAINAW